MGAEARRRITTRAGVEDDNTLQRFLRRRRTSDHEKVVKELVRLWGSGVVTQERQV